jgi:aspartate/methionine/tyrosine aminotransferase
MVNDFLRQHPELACEPSRFGTTIFPRLKNGSTSAFVERLLEKYETSVVPGEFFEQPQHFRVGLCGTTESVKGGLERLDAALKSLQH